MPRKPKPKQNWNEKAAQLFRCPEACSNRQYIAYALGVKLWTLESLSVGYGYDERAHEYYSSWPEFTANGVACGIIRRYKDGTKKMIEGGNHGVYFNRGRDFDLPGPVFLVEGGSDTAALMGAEINVVGRPSNLAGIDECATLLKGVKKKIVFIGERDEKPDKRGQIESCPATCTGCLRCWPGLYGAKESAKRLSEALGRECEAALIKGCKDAREWCRSRPMASLRRFTNALEYIK